MIDVGLERLAPHLGDEAAAVVWTSLPRQASVRASSLCQRALDSGRPDELGAVAGFGVLSPTRQSGWYWSISSRPERIGWLRRAYELVAAEIVGAALHVADAQLAQERFEEGHVAEEELILQGLGAGGDDDALAGAQGGQQIGEGFAGAGAGFDDQVAVLG